MGLFRYNLKRGMHTNSVGDQRNYWKQLASGPSRSQSHVHFPYFSILFCTRIPSNIIHLIHPRVPTPSVRCKRPQPGCGSCFSPTSKAPRCGVRRGRIRKRAANGRGGEPGGSRVTDGSRKRRKKRGTDPPGRNARPWRGEGAWWAGSASLATAIAAAVPRARRRKRRGGARRSPCGGGRRSPHAGPRAPGGRLRGCGHCCRRPSMCQPRMTRRRKTQALPGRRRRRCCG